MYVDLDTGTILNGPIVFIPLDVEFSTEDLTDGEVIALAAFVGTPMTPSLMEQ
jgi:hypothetical protein